MASRLWASRAASYRRISVFYRGLLLINSSPYDKRWIIKVEVSNSVELNHLMDADKYTKFCEEEDASH